MIIVSQVNILRILMQMILYGWAMSQYHPHSGFKQLKQREIDGFVVNLSRENSSHKYILKVDLEYPNELHGLHNEYLLAAEKCEISHAMLSNNVVILQINKT